MSKEFRPGLVSVIIPTFNRAALLGRAIKSVLDQTYRNFEVIISDDGSTDNTKEVVDHFKNPDIRYTRNSQNRGQSHARNRGVVMAEGEYVAFLDSDDFWLPNKLAVQMAAFKKCPDIGLVYSNVFLSSTGSDIRKVKFGFQFFKSGFLFREVLLWQVMCQLPTWLTKKECFLSIGGFDEELSMIEDRDFIVRFAHRYKLYGIAEPLAVVLYHNEGRVSDTSAQKLEYVYSQILRKISKLIETENFEARVVKTISAKYSSDVGRLYLSEGNFSKARRCFLDALSFNPFNYQLYLYLLSSANNTLYNVMKGAKNTIRRSFT